MKTFLQFQTAQEARDYRRSTGCGGFIFEDESTGHAWIFPPDMTPSAIFLHPITRDRGGVLIA